MTPKKNLARIVGVLVLLTALGAIAWQIARNIWGDSRSSTSLLLSGNIEAHESVLSFKSVQSRIVALPFNEGQWVANGTEVAAVDDNDLRQQLAIAEASLAVQQRQFEAATKNIEAAHKTVLADQAELAQRQLDLRRNQELKRQDFVSSAAIDQSRTVVQTTEAVLQRDEALEAVAEKNRSVLQAGVTNGLETVKLAQLNLDYTRLKAPFDGVVTVRQAELGEVVSPGTPILTMADLDHIWLRAYLNETDLGKVRLGQGVAVTTDTFPGKRYHGRLSFISSKAEFTPKSVETHAERVTLVYRVKIDIDNPTHELVPGMPADARLDIHPSGSK